PVERERGVKRWKRTASDDVLTDPQPVRIQHCVTRPRLQIGNARGEWRRANSADRPRCREPIELSTVGELHLRNEEVVIRRQVERRGEGDVKLYFSARQWAVAHGRLVGRRMNPARLDRVQCRERRAQYRGRERQLTDGGRVSAIE